MKNNQINALAALAALAAVLYGGTVQTAATLVSSRKSGFVALKRFSTLLAAVLGCILFFFIFIFFFECIVIC